MGSIVGGDTRRISFDNSSGIVSAAMIAETCLSEDCLSLNLIAKQEEENNEELDHYGSKKAARQAAASAGEEYWLNRVDNLQKAHQNINKIIEDEYEIGIENTKKMLTKPTYDHLNIKRASRCEELQTKVIKCYRENPEHSLECSSIVQAFNSFVYACRNEDCMDTTI